MNAVVTLSADQAAKAQEVGALLALEISVDGKLANPAASWAISPAPETGWLPCGSFLLSSASLKPVSSDGTLAKFSIEGVLRLPGELRTCDFRIAAEGEEILVAGSSVAKDSARPLQQPENAPPWLLPTVDLGGWNVWLLSCLGILLLVALGFLLREILRRLALRSIMKWNHRDRALRELQGLEKYARAKSADQEQWKKFSFELAGILRKYSDENFHMDSRDMTDREFLAELRFHPKGKAHTDLIGHILLTITEVRYGTKLLELQMMPNLLQEGKKYVEAVYVPKEEAKK